MDLKCQICGSTEGLKRCACCKRVAYCGRAHQVLDWREHKLQCQQSLPNDEVAKCSGSAARRIETEQVQAQPDCLSLYPSQTIQPTNVEGFQTYLSPAERKQNLHHAEHIDNFQEQENKLIQTSNSKSDSQSQPRPHTPPQLCIDVSDSSINSEEIKGSISGDLPEGNNSTQSSLPSSHKVQNTSDTFDKRPYKNIKFSKPKSLASHDISTHVAAHLENHGFCVIDNIICEKNIEKVHQEVEGIETSGKFQSGKLAGGRTSGEESKKVVNANIRSDIITWLEGNETEWPAISHLVGVMDDTITSLNAHLDGEVFLSGRTKAMVACYPADGASYMRHVDNPNKDGRRVTCICYLNKNWDVQQHGGLLRIFPATLTDDYIDVAPLMNRMLFFWSDHRMPHEVQPAFAKRYAITVWYFDDTERKAAKTAQVNTEIAKVRGEIALLDIKKKEIEKAMVEKQIQTEAEKAVAGLSDGELQAIAELVKKHPDPTSLLTSMGINPNIQKSLFIVLRTRFGVNV